MNNELLEALTVLEKEKDISKETMLEAIENSLLTACKNHFGKADNVHVAINPETCDFGVYAEECLRQGEKSNVLRGDNFYIDKKQKYVDLQVLLWYYFFIDFI